MYRLLLLLLLIPATFYGQQIDTINSDSTALAFMKSINVIRAEGKVEVNAGLRRSLDSAFPVITTAKYYEKADFDNNGYTDLLFNGDNGYSYLDAGGLISLPMVILSYGKDSFQVKDLSIRDQVLFIGGNVLHTSEQPLIGMIYLRVLEDRKSKKGYKEILGFDTLVCAFNQFVEKKQPAHNIIHKVSFLFSCGFSITCRNYKLELTQDTTWLYRQDEDLFHIMKYVAKTDTVLWNQVTGLLTSVDFPHLKNDYKIGQTDNASACLTIQHDRDKVKAIKDYGLMGTFGLRAVYDLFISANALYKGKFIEQTQGFFWE